MFNSVILADVCVFLLRLSRSFILVATLVGMCGIICLILPLGIYFLAALLKFLLKASSPLYTELGGWSLGNQILFLLGILSSLLF